MKVSVQKKWTTAYFYAAEGDISVRLELTINHVDNTWNMCTKSQEMVKFDGDTLLETKLKSKAIQEAIKFIQKELCLN